MEDLAFQAGAVGAGIMLFVLAFERVYKVVRPTIQPPCGLSDDERELLTKAAEKNGISSLEEKVDHLAGKLSEHITTNNEIIATMRERLARVEERTEGP